MDVSNFKYDFHTNYNLKIKKEIYKTKGLSGLVNCGNKCYLNSIVQCLSNSLLLTDYIISNKYKEDLNIKKHKNEHYLLNSYVSVINNIWEENQIIKPKSLIENISKFHRSYFSTEQQDSHECLLYILDLLHRSISYEIELSIDDNTNILTNAALETWRLFYEKEYSFIIKIFNGNLINNIKCNSCNLVENIFEPFNNLSIGLTNYSLNDCLKDYFSSKNIDSWNCSKCKLFGCSKNTKLWAVPSYVIIHLNRFNQDTFAKNKTKITFPIKDLNLSEFISCDKLDSNNYIYDLYAINYHHGEKDSGHYTSACKNLDGCWYLFNDGDISRYQSNNLDTQLITNDAYILFYVRKVINKLN